MNLLQACSDPKVFGSAFRNRESWQSWFAFLAALFGLPLTPEQLVLYQQCTGRKLAPSNRVREAPKLEKQGVGIGKA
jgi:hypothetical protein